MRKISVFITSLVLLSGISMIFTTPARAASFDPGRIIDDGKFTNKNSMSVADIQNFLNSKVPVCDTWHAPGPGAQGANPPWYCLKDYVDHSVGKGSAQIIWEAAQNYGINPQVLLVTLQKENGLITDTWPYPWQYRTAMGFGCPDGAPCDAQWFGFANQVNQAARHFRNFYDQNPNWYMPHRLGGNNIKWNPNANCGTSYVNIVTRGTSALYSYTPYRPNDAALNNLYGTGDGCSSYGNRNFWRDFNNWFGSTLDDPYVWQFEGQSWDRDLSNLPRGEKATLTVLARNVGTATWTNSGNTPMRLGTSNPRDRGSGFQSSSWLAGSRPATMREASVAPGQVATFSFTIQATPAPGVYNEYFNLVADGITWLNDPGQYFQIRVTSPIYSGAVQQNNYTASVANNVSTPTTIKVQNTGNVTWYKDGAFPVRLGTYNPIDRNSPFRAPTWFSNARPSTFAESAVAPGQVATFSFNMQSPNTPGSYNESFSLVADNLQWFNQAITQSYTVGGVAVVTKPVYRHYNPKRLAHFYTTDPVESNAIRGEWNYEGIGWYVPTTPTSTPIYRHYSARTLSHFYTLSEPESMRIRQYDWGYEGVGWYASDTPTTTPVYRHYSPARGRHFYTTDENESLRIRSQGWNYEGIGWYAFSQ